MTSGYFSAEAVYTYGNAQLLVAPIHEGAPVGLPRVSGEFVFNARTEAQILADNAFAAGKSKGGASVLTLLDGGPPIKGVSGTPRSFTVEMRAFLDSLPTSAKRMGISGQCAEIFCINQALTEGRPLNGGVMDTVSIGSTGEGHGQPLSPCPTCRRAETYFGVTSKK